MNKKVLIFDFDGTLYSGEHKFDLVEGKVCKNRRKFLPHINDDQYAQLIKDEPQWLTRVSGAEIVDCIYQLKNKYPQYNISTDAFWQWQQEDIYEIILDEEQTVNISFMEELCKKYAVYIVSNSSPNHIVYYMKKIGLNPDWFKDIYSNHFEEYDRTKKHYYEEILNRENANPEDSYVFGDSKNSDLVPAQILGINTALVLDSRDIPSIVAKTLL